MQAVKWSSMEPRKVLALVLLGIMSIANSSAFSQALREGQSALVYYMPQTILVFDIDYDVITQTRGMFYQYSERYLGTKEVVTEDAVQYALTDIRMHTHTQADKSRSYVVSLSDKALQNCHISLTEIGLLRGVNLQDIPSQQPPKTKSASECEPAKTKEETCIIPYLEEQMRANSVAKMAESTAKQIYRIREARLNILAGDVDHLPADGEAMRLTLKELDKQEKALVELFTGKQKVEKRHYSIVYTPQETVSEEVLIRFSRYSGVVEKDDLSGEPVYLNIAVDKTEYAPATEESQAQLSPFYYNIPAIGTVRVLYKEQEMVSKELSFPQFGLSVGLSQDLFKKSAPVIEIDTKTGALKSIKK